MADTDIIVSEMTPASQINTGDLMIMTQPDAQAETGYSTKSATVLQVANKQLKGIDFPTDLPSFDDPNVLGGLEELKADIKALLPVSSASGNPCTFDTDISDKLVSLKAAILASGGGGTPATPNPIVGHSELNLVRCGKNLARSDYSGGASATSKGVTFTNNNGVVNVSTETATGTAYYDLYSNRDGERLKIKAGTYTVSCAETTSTCTINFSLIGGDLYVLHNNTHSVTFTVTQETEMYAYVRVALGTSNINLDLHFQIEVGSTATPYAPYNGTPYLVQFGQTVYGGVYDANSGKVTITYALVVFDGSNDEVWSNYSNNDNQYRYWIALTNCKSGSNGEQKSNYLQSTTGVVSSGNSSVIRNNYASCTLFDDGSRVYINANTVITADTMADFKDYLSNNPLQLLYPLATPIEIDVSELSVEAIEGVNNIVSDCGGDVEVQFRDSIQHYIDSKIASVQALIL